MQPILPRTAREAPSLHAHDVDAALVVAADGHGGVDGEAHAGAPLRGAARVVRHLG